MAEDDSARPMRALVPGTRLGRYVIVDRIGRGGMAEVFLARADGLKGFEKLVAVKVIHEEMVDDPSHVRMLLEEARLAAGLDHPNIVQVFDVGADRHEHYLTMEYVHGRDLRQVLRELAGRERMPLLLALTIVHEIARALHYAHTRKDNTGRPLGIVHRDVSPSNIIVSFAGAVKLTDFGIAKVSAHTAQTRTGTFKGKFGYMSPEQYLQLDVDARSDVFSLGIVLYELTTGRRAFSGENPFAAMNKAVDGDYVAPQAIVPDYPPALADIVAHALAPDVDARYCDAASMADDLDRLARALGGPATRGALEEFVAALFGRPEPPDVSHIGVRPTIATSSEPSRGRTRSSRRAPLMMAGAAALVAGALGWQAGRAADSQRNETSHVAEAPVTAPVEAEHDVATKAEPIAPLPIAAEPARVDATAASASTAATRGPSRSRPSAARKRPKPDKSAAEPTPGLDSMLPPSAKSGR